MRCASVTIVQNIGHPPFPDPEDNLWAPGVRISWGRCVVDLVAGIASVLVVARLLRYEAGRMVGLACFWGVVAGLMVSLGTPATDECTLLTWVGVAFISVGLPAMICFHTRRASSACIAIAFLAASVAVMPWAYRWCDQFKTEYRFTLAHHSKTTLKPSVEDMVVGPLVCGGVLVIPVLLMRRFVPGWRKQATIA
jgi:prepilin signal peptidase PulO-like enzyme (type II secretory pathway)